ncbi:hypothetical protein BCR36DRAFT_463188, partial [Piromyces finnis]
MKGHVSLTKDSKKLCNIEIGMDLMKATLGVLSLDESTNSTIKNNNHYILKDDKIIHKNPNIQKIIKEQSINLKDYCCKLYHCLDTINNSDLS